MLGAEYWCLKFCRGIVHTVKFPKDLWDFLFSGNKFSYRQNIVLWAQFGELIANNYDFVHVANSFLFPKLSKVLDIKKFPVVVTFRGQDIYIRPFIVPEWANWLKVMYEQATYLHFVSNAMKQFAIEQGAPDEKCIVIYPGIDVNFYCRKRVIGSSRHREKDVIELTTVGRLIWEKGYDIALNAVKKLVDRGYQVHYNIIGGGDELPKIDFLIRRLDLKNNVTLWGVLHSERVRDILWNSDIYIQPSFSESFGVSVVEAQAMELPVVCTNVGGLPEIVESGVTGMCIPPFDVNALVEVIAHLCTEPVARTEMGRRGRIRAEKLFSLEIEVKQWRSLYRTGTLL